MVLPVVVLLLSCCSRPNYLFAVCVITDSERPDCAGCDQ